MMDKILRREFNMTVKKYVFIVDTDVIGSLSFENSFEKNKKVEDSLADNSFSIIGLSESDDVMVGYTYNGSTFTPPEV
jgi:hypothetical protein